MKYIVKTTQTLGEALASLAPDSSKTSLRSWVKEGRVLVDGTPNRNFSAILNPDQVVTLGPRCTYGLEGMKIYYEDSHLVVIDKPTGLLTVSTAFQQTQTAHAYLKRRYKSKKVFVVHRLDQDASGVMMFALSESCSEALKDLFQEHDLQRTYIAIVEGCFEAVGSAGTWRSYLYEDENYVVHEVRDSRKGSLAITHYEVLAMYKEYTWLQLKLETGKKNQIRVHCQSAGHPIVGDKKYGSKVNPIHRLCLHAHRLEFVHPMTQQKLDIKSPIPESFDYFKKK